MSERQTGQGNVPEASGAEEQAAIEAYYYDYVGGLLVSEDMPQTAFGADSQTMQDIFVSSQGNYLTPVNTFRVLEQVAQGPTNLPTLQTNIPIPKTAVTRTVNYLSSRGIVGQSEWMFALDPETIRETGDQTAVQNDSVNAVLQTAESLSNNHDETIYVTKERFLEHLTGLRPDLGDKQEAVWNSVVFEIQRQYRAWTNGIEFTSPEARNKRQRAVALTPVFQKSIREMMAKFEKPKQNFSAHAVAALQNIPLIQRSWSVQEQHFEHEQEKTAALQRCADVAIKRSLTVDAILAMDAAEVEFDIKDAFWPRMLFGYGYERRRQQVPWHSWRS